MDREPADREGHRPARRLDAPPERPAGTRRDDDREAAWVDGVHVRGLDGARPEVVELDVEQGDRAAAREEVGHPLADQVDTAADGAGAVVEREKVDHGYPGAW